MYQYQAQIWIFKAPKGWIGQRHHHTQYKMLQGCLVYHGISFLRIFKAVNTPIVPKWKKSKEKIEIHKIFNGLIQNFKLGGISS